MSHFSTALSEIVERSFSAKWAELGRRCNLDPSVISRLAAGKFEPTLDRLEQIAATMNRHDRKQLLMAAARDRVPASYQDELFGDEDPASQLLRAKLSPDLAAVIRYLESSAMGDDTTAAYLRKIGQWVGITAPAAPDYGGLRVAEDTSAYRRPIPAGVGEKWFALLESHTGAPVAGSNLPP